MFKKIIIVKKDEGTFVRRRCRKVGDFTAMIGEPSGICDLLIKIGFSKSKGETINE